MLWTIFAILLILCFLLCGNPIPTTTESTESQKLSKASWFTSGQQSCLSNRISTGISVLAPNSRSLYTPLGTPTHKYFLWASPRLGTKSRLCECELRLVTIQNAPGAVHTQEFADIRT